MVNPREGLLREGLSLFFKVTASVTEVAPVTLFPSRETAVAL